VEILTTRFGPITIRPEDRVEFPKGLVGVPHLKRFALVPDPQACGLVWLQSTRDPAWALALVAPRSFTPNYVIRATPEHLRPIQADSGQDVEVFVTLSRTVQSFTLNLQAPFLIHRARGLGMQLVLSDSKYSVRHEVTLRTPMRMSA
jgi:flagellar assembly factor FliW